ncbi:MAG: dihydrolipoyl dehydrogenase [Phycisphaeraceae bacterium]|nr:dihydrolipoyl dehydrogenase [Phycisphaeraceae bacterium]
MPSANVPHVVIIGAGPAGYPAAFHAADLGLNVTLIDPEAAPGGVCLYRGCIPSKALLHIAAFLNEAKALAAHGITVEGIKIDLDKLRGFKESVIQKLTGGLGQLTKQRKIKLVQGTAEFSDAHHVTVTGPEGQSESLAFDYAVIATGSMPTKIPAWPESPRIMDSTGALALEDIPESLLVVGGGYIGLELGQVYSALGTDVSVVEMMPQLVPGADPDLIKVLAQRLKKQFSDILLETRVAQMEESGTGVKVSLEAKDGKVTEQTYSKVLVAIGRRPTTAGLGLEHTQVKVNEQGFIEIDNQARTAEPTIFAIGDVAGQPMLAHKATAEAKVAVEVIAGQKSVFEPKAIPAVMFTDPEIAWCGLTESEAKAQDRDVFVTTFPWAASGRATSLGRNDGVTKLIMDPETHRILGMGIAGAGAGELIAEGTLAVEMGAVAEDLALTIHPHPTLSETIMEAAEAADGQSIHAYRPKRK